MEVKKKMNTTSFNEVNNFNKELMNEFLENSTELAPQSREAYRVCLRMWFVWVKDFLNNKRHVDIVPLEFKRFQKWLIENGSSSATVNNRRGAISSLNNYIETYYPREYPMFRNFVNRNIKYPLKIGIKEKNPVTKEECNYLISVLTEFEDWQKIAYLTFTLETGCRRGESRQLLKKVTELNPITKETNGKFVTYYETHPIRCKGAGKEGKKRTFCFGQATMNALKKWVDFRGNDDCPYMFVNTQRNKVQQVGAPRFNVWCDKFSEIVGKHIHPHSLRTSRATQLSEEEGVDIRIISKLLGHEQVSTTEKHYVVRDDANDLLTLF